MLALADYTGASGAGSTYNWSHTTNAHGGANAEQIAISTYGDGDEKLLSVQDTNAAEPVIASASPLAGGTLSGTQYYQLTSTTATGETPASAEVSVVADGTIKLAWSAAKGATGYRVCRGRRGPGDPSRDDRQRDLVRDTGAVRPVTSSRPWRTRRSAARRALHPPSRVTPMR